MKKGHFPFTTTINNFVELCSTLESNVLLNLLARFPSSISWLSEQTNYSMIHVSESMIWWNLGHGASASQNGVLHAAFHHNDYDFSFNNIEEQ